jgi:glycosyltransferase involved in cell wall biosynthesis
MRILEINTEKGWRGGENQTLLALIGFRKLGHEAELLCFENSALHMQAAAAGFTCHPLTSSTKSIGFLMKYGKNYSILHTQTSKQLTYCILTKPFHNSKVILSRRVDFVPKGFFTLLKYNACDGIICVSGAIEKILKQAGIKTRTVVISDCVTEKTLNKTRAQELLQKLTISGKNIIGTTAALVPHKDPVTLVNAVNILRTKRSDFVLLHFGSGPLAATIQQFITDNNLQDYYKLIGFKERVEDYFSIFNYFVMSSQEEGLGSSVLDAFVYKVPVVSTNAGGLNELVTGRGYVTEKKNAQLLAEALHTAMNSPEQNKKNVAAGYTYAVSNLSVEKIHEEHIDFFKTV